MEASRAHFLEALDELRSRILARALDVPVRFDATGLAPGRTRCGAGASTATRCAWRGRKVRWCSKACWNSIMRNCWSSGGHRDEPSSLLANIDGMLARQQLIADAPAGANCLAAWAFEPCVRARMSRPPSISRPACEICLRSQDKRVLYGFLGLAQLAANQRDYAQAFVRLRDAERLMQQRQIPDTVYRGVLLQISSHFWLQQGRPRIGPRSPDPGVAPLPGPHGAPGTAGHAGADSRVSEYLLVLAEVYLHRAQSLWPGSRRTRTVRNDNGRCRRWRRNCSWLWPKSPG